MQKKVRTECCINTKESLQPIVNQRKEILQPVSHQPEMKSETKFTDPCKVFFAGNKPRFFYFCDYGMVSRLAFSSPGGQCKFFYDFYLIFFAFDLLLFIFYSFFICLFCLLFMPFFPFDGDTHLCRASVSSLFIFCRRMITVGLLIVYWLSPGINCGGFRVRNHK